MSNPSNLMQEFISQDIVQFNGVLTYKFVDSDFKLKTPAHFRQKKGFPFSNLDEESEDEDAALISSDPALYWAKMKRKSLRRNRTRKKGTLNGSFSTNKGNIHFYLFTLMSYSRLS